MHHVVAKQWPRPRSISAWIVSLYLAVVMVILAVSQLFEFEKMPDILHTYGIPFLNDYGLIVISIIVCFEVFAVPFLLAMRLSTLAHYLSLVCGFGALVGWLVLSTWLAATQSDIPNTGFFGSPILVPSGWWLVIYIVALLVLLAYVSWSSVKDPMPTSKVHPAQKMKRKDVS